MNSEVFSLCAHTHPRLPLAAPKLRMSQCSVLFDSYGILAGDIPALATGALRLARSITDALFIDNADRHRAAMMAFEEPELRPTSYYVPPEQRRSRAV